MRSRVTSRRPGASALPSPALPRAIWVLGFVSLLMDISSEMVHSLLPLFLVVLAFNFLSPVFGLLLSLLLLGEALTWHVAAGMAAVGLGLYLITRRRRHGAAAGTPAAASGIRQPRPERANARPVGVEVALRGPDPAHRGHGRRQFRHRAG